MEYLYEKAQESAEYIKMHTTKRPKIAVVLGSGLGNLTADFTETEELPYKDIPNFPVSTVAGHKGALLAGKLGEKEVYALEGRFHFYEGYSMKEVCYPFYVLKLLGVEQVVLTNACGGINREFAPGTLMLLTDFINMMGTNPLIGPNDERFGPRFPDMTEPYSLELRNLAKQTADELGISYQEGVYLGFMGPCYETAAEIRAFAGMGADAVGMSTVPENHGLQLSGYEGAGRQLYHEYGHRHPDGEAQPRPRAGDRQSGRGDSVPLAGCGDPEGGINESALEIQKMHERLSKNYLSVNFSTLHLTLLTNGAITMVCSEGRAKRESRKVIEPPRKALPSEQHKDFLTRPERRDWRNDLCLCLLFSMRICSMISLIRSGTMVRWSVR